MLLKKLAKVRRTILWCAAFAVSHLAFGAEIAADPLGNLGMPDFYSAELGGYRCVAPGASVDVVTNATTKGKVVREVIPGAIYNNLRFSTEPAVGYHLEHWKTYGKYIEINYQGYFMPTNNIEKASLLIVHQPVTPEPHFVIEPIFLPNTYVISFDPNGGTLPDGTSETKDVSFDSAYGELPTPICHNYTFNGWWRKYLDADEVVCEERVTARTIVHTAKDDTLTAKWTEYPKYDITIRADAAVENMFCMSSDELKPFVVSPNTKIAVHKDGWIKVWGSTSKEGYSIAAIDENTAVVIDPITREDSLEIRATPNNYSVTFALEGGSLPQGAPTTYSVTYDSNYGDLPMPTRAGYAFVGWYLRGNKIDSGTTVKTAADHELIANWEPKFYSLRKEITDGSGRIVANPNSSTYAYDSKVELTVEPDEGYSFKCWDDDLNAPISRKITIAEVNVYSATLTANVYRVTFNPGTVLTAEPSFASRYYAYNSSYGELPTISHFEYDFVGWYTKATSGTKITTEDIFDALNDDTVLYAHWKKLPRYEVTLEKGKGVSKIYYKRDLEDDDWIKYVEGEPIEVVSKRTFSAYAVASTGYTSVTSPDNPFSSDPIEDADVFTLTATPNTYTITFDSNDGSACASQPVTMDAAYGELPLPTLSGAKFLGWYLNDTRITAESIFSAAENITLVAKWQAFDPKLTAAADCDGLMIRSEGNPSFKTQEDGVYVYLSLTGSLEGKETNLISDIEGTGKLSFWWKLQNYGTSAEYAAVADLVINGKSIPAHFGNEFTAGEFPTTTWRYEEIELKNVSSLRWRVSSDGRPHCNFYIDNIKWVKSELEMWAELLDCAATEEDVAEAKQEFSKSCKLTISFDKNGKPVLAVTGVSAELAAKVKIECREDLSESTWNEHDPAQHSDCRFYRGTLDLDL